MEVADKVRKAAPDDLPQISTALSRAFFDDPLFAWALPDADRRQRLLPEFFATRAFLRHHQSYTSIGDVVAAALWAPPRGPALPHLAGDGGAASGRLAGVAGHRASFAADLADSVAFGDARYADIRKLLGEQLATRGITAPELPDPPPFHADPPLELDLNGFGVAIFTSGFRPDYARWVRFPAFDTMGFPLTDNGASTEPARLAVHRGRSTSTEALSPAVNCGSSTSPSSSGRTRRAPRGSARSLQRAPSGAGGLVHHVCRSTAISPRAPVRRGSHRVPGPPTPRPTGTPPATT